MAIKIAIDAGHGKYTSGKRCLKSIDPNETREWWLNQRVATQVVTHLQRCGANVLRLDDPTGETDVPLKTRSRSSNRWGANWCVSIHHDSGIGGGSGGGATVYVYSGSHSAASDRLQANVYDAFTATVGPFGNRAQPLNSANFHMVRKPTMPAILIECGFMDSTVDTPMILTEDFARKAALGIAKGICNAAGLAWVAEAGQAQDNVTTKEEIDMTKAEVEALIDQRVETKVAAKLAALTGIAGTGDKPSPWAKEAVEWAQEHGLFAGDGNGNYGWQCLVTREQLAVILYSAVSLFDSMMVDWLARQGEHPADSWALPALDFCQDNNYMVGDGNGNMRPQSFVTRQELAQVIQNMNFV